jgi:hypothetical protein
MMTITAPPPPAGDISTIQKLLDLIIDPKAHRERLNQLIAAHQAAGEAEAAAHAAQAAAQTKVNEASDLHAAAQAKMDASGIASAELAERERSVTERERAAKVREESISAEAHKREQEAAQREGALRERETVHAAKEKQLADERARFEVDRTALDRKMAAAQAFIKA